MKLIVSISAIWLAACGGKSAPAPAPAPTPTPACEVVSNTPADVECALTTMTGYTDKVCACTTGDCANLVTTDMATWMKATDSKLGDVKPTPEQEERMTTISTRYEGCMGKLVGTEPDAAGSGAGPGMAE